jgi:sugar-phosphatase
MSSSAAGLSVHVHCQAVLFDMDGILISSLGSVERTWTKWSVMRGIDPAYTRSFAHGRRAIDTLAVLRPDLDSEAELRIVEEMEMADNEGLRVLPGVLDLLHALPGGRWAVVTSATERLARARLAAGGIAAPQRMVTADGVSRGKPHPEPFLAAAAQLGLPPQQCVVFEDSPSGARAGREAGCTVIATTFSHSMESLDAAHYHVSDLTGVTAQASSDGLMLTLALLTAAPR